MSGPLEPSPFRPPEGFVRVVERLEEAGFEAWAVGGAIRDDLYRALIGRGPRARADWDVATAARPPEVLDLFRRTVPLGIEHGTVGVLGSDGVLYEVTTFRRDIETDGRHATVTFADSVEEDLGRRDFTINALAWRPRTGEMRDPFSGMSDLERGVLRAVGEPHERFREDYLRVLRGLRFAGRFDLEIESSTRLALEEAVGGLPRLSAERVREELLKVLGDPVPSTALDLYAEVGALRHWYPELQEAAGEREVWMGALAAVDAIRPHRPLLRLARWLVPIADGPEERRERAARLLEHLRFSNADRRRVAGLVRHYLPFIGPLDSSARIRRWLAEVGDAWRDLFRLHIGDARASHAPEAAGYVVAAWRVAHATRLDHPPLDLSGLAVDGEDVLDLGVPRGPLVGLVLEELFEQVLEDPERNRREALLAEARRLIELGALAVRHGGGEAGAGGARTAGPGDEDGPRTRDEERGADPVGPDDPEGASP